MTGTHKLGLLLVLLDLAPHHFGGNRTVSRRELATRHIDIHWDHARKYGSRDLRQTSSKKQKSDSRWSNDTTTMVEIRDLRAFLWKRSGTGVQDLPFDVLQHRVAGFKWHREWSHRLQESTTRIERALWKNPVRLLQQLPKVNEFLYHRTRDSIVFLPGVPEDLTDFADVLRPLIEFQFARLVAKINREAATAPDQLVHSHLFGRHRAMPPTSIRDAIEEIQGGKCVFTGALLSKGQRSVDHVIPWSRLRLSQIENLVVTTRSVNSQKSRSLLGPSMVRRWLDHTLRNSARIRTVATNGRWPTGLTRLLNATLNLYSVAHDNVGVWEGPAGMEPLSRRGREEIVHMLERAIENDPSQGHHYLPSQL